MHPIADEIVIKLPRAVLILYQGEIYKALKPEYLEKALRRGKGYKRAETRTRREGRLDKFVSGN